MLISHKDNSIYCVDTVQVTSPQKLVKYSNSKPNTGIMERVKLGKVQSKPSIIAHHQLSDTSLPLSLGNFDKYSDRRV